MLLSDAIEALAVATIADGRSLRTVGDYRQKLAALAAFLGPARDVASITPDDLRAFVVDLRSRSTRYAATTARPEIAGGLSVASVAGYVRAVRRLFAFLHEEGTLPSNPARRLQSPKIPRGEPKAYQVDDFLKLLAVTAGDDPASLRDRAIILFLADTGCRVGGLAGLAPADLDMRRRIARLTEKGGKVRLVPFSEPTRAALAAWLAVRPDGGGLWVNLGNRGGETLTVEGIRQVMKRRGRAAGVEGPVNPHSFRHGFAREYLLNGGDLASLADLLGHSDVHVTWQHYAIFQTAELAAKHDKHSPVARMGRESEL